MKENHRIPNSLFTFFGVILLVLGLFVLINQLAIKDALGKTMPVSIKGFYDISVFQSWNGCNVEIYFSPRDDRFKSESICGQTAIDIMDYIKLRRSNLDGKINRYNFIFKAADSSVKYTAVYDNTIDSDEIKLALSEDDMILPAKSFAEYTAESFELRDQLSTLYQYDVDRCADFFFINGAKMTFTGRKATIQLILENTSAYDYNEVLIRYEYIDQNGKIVKDDYSFASDVKSGKAYRLNITDYLDPVPYFRITNIGLYYDEAEHGSMHFAFN